MFGSVEMRLVERQVSPVFTRYTFVSPMKIVPRIVSILRSENCNICIGGSVCMNEPFNERCARFCSALQALILDLSA